MQWCTMIATVVSFGVLVWGFVELLSRRSVAETELGVISRQLRGLGWIALAPFLVIVSSVVCGLVTGQFQGVMQPMRRALGTNGGAF